MLHALRSRSALLVIAAFVLAGGFARWLLVRDHTISADYVASVVDFSASSSAVGAEPDPAAPKSDESAVRIEYRGKPGDLYYYAIENDITDDVAIYTQMFRLPSSTTFKDARTIIQSIAPAPTPATQPVRPHLPPAPAPATSEAQLCFEWEVDRYRASEVVTDMAEVSFDSLKHTHPPRELSGLAKVPGSKASFRFDGRTGAVSTIFVKPGPGTHPTDNRQSKTAENGLVTTENMQELLYAMGEQFLPGAPKNVGDQWEIKRVKPSPPFGTVTTIVTCKFKSLEKVGNSEIALIELTGVNFFEASPIKPPTPAPAIVPAPTTRPTTSMPRYPIAPRPPTPYKPTTRAVPHPTPRPFPRSTSQPTSRPATHIQPPRGANIPPSASRPVDPSPSTGEFDPSLDPAVPHFPVENSTEQQPANATNTDEQPTSSPVVPVVLSQPVNENAATSHPASQPVTTTPAKPTEEPFQMPTAHFSGFVRFDVTHGRLVELDMRSNANFEKVMRSDKEEMKIKQGFRHILRIKGLLTPPPRPNIPGGPKPPVEKPLPNARPTVHPVGATSRPAQQGTTQPAGSGISRPMGNATTRPVSTNGATTLPVTSLKQPAVPYKSIAPGIATPQPRPATQPTD